MSSLYRVPRSFFSRNRSVFTLGLVALMISSLGRPAGRSHPGLHDRARLQLLPGLMILIPPAIGMRGNVFGALGSRLGTAMHIGTFELSYRQGQHPAQQHGVVAAADPGHVRAHGRPGQDRGGRWASTPSRSRAFVFISVLGGVLAGLVLILINILVAAVGFRRNWDIDNISAPLITAAGDIVTLPMLFLAAIIVMAAPRWTIAVIASGSWSSPSTWSTSL